MLKCRSKPVPRTTKTMRDFEPAGLSSDDAAAEDGVLVAVTAADIFEAFS